MPRPRPRRPPLTLLASSLFAIFVALMLKGTALLRCPRGRAYLNSGFIYSGARKTNQRRHGKRRRCGMGKRRRSRRRALMMARRSRRVN
jgi:hypothetical protein